MSEEQLIRSRPNADQVDEIIRVLKQIAGQYDTGSAASIVAAIRGGNSSMIPNGSVFKETHAVFGDIYFVTRARNMHKVAGDSSRPTITIQPLYLLSDNGGASAKTFQYDRPEAMFGPLETAIPSGTVVHAYASHKATTALATMAISSGAGSATVDLGSWETDGNHPQRISYGSNNEEQSNFFQWLNGDSGSGYMDSIWVPKTKYDMMCTAYTSMKGFLGGFSDEFRSYLGLCSIPNLTNDVFESQDSAHAKQTQYNHNGYFFLPSRKEIYGTSENVREDGETQFDYYKDIGTTNADKLMYAKNAASPTTYWLRTPIAGHAHGVRVCHAGHGGALDYYVASNSHGAAPLAILA